MKNVVINSILIMKKLLFLLLFLVPIIIFSQESKKIAHIDSVLNYLHQRQLFNGSLLIGKEGKILYKKTFGNADPKNDTPLNNSSAFNLASVSKQFFSMMIMILKEQGKLNYDESVQKYLPNFPYNNISIRQLMNHTSGLPDYFEIAKGDMTLLDTLSNKSLLELLALKKPNLVFQSGEKWQYCDTNYAILASVLEMVSGSTSDKFFQQYIAAPLKMNNSYVYHLKMKSYPPSRVFGMRYEGGKSLSNDLIRFDGVVGDGNVYASAEDLYKWDQALYTGKILNKSSFTEAITSGKLNNGAETKYGFGWDIIEPGKTVAHTGNWVGFNAAIIRYIDKNQTLIILDNSSNSYANKLIPNIWEEKPIALPQTQLITNIKVIDGTGLPAYAANVRLVDDRIQDIGSLKVFKNESTTDGKGKVLAPGFIDSHSHHASGLDEKPEGIAATNQGITTIVIGQDGESVPIDTILSSIKKIPVSINIATYTGQVWLREKIMKDDVGRKATTLEIDAMKILLASEMDKGSLGLSTGLEYEAAYYSSRDEVVELAKVAASKGGRYISHIRSEDMYLDEAIDEIIDIGREAKIPVQISHLKIAMRSRWGNSGLILKKLQQARLEGINITADVYPYTMWNSTPRVLFPEKDFDNLASAEFATQELFDPANSVMVRYAPSPTWQGKTVTEIAAINNETAAQALLRIIRETSAIGQDGTIVAKSMSETDISNFLKWPFSNVCSDGSMGGHPRGHGSFSRVLGRYVREQKLIPLETAIQKMTSLSAENVGIKNRGLIAPGYFADLVLFDPNTIMDNATVSNPTALSTGIQSVWVNGKLVYNEQKSVPNFTGKFIKMEKN
ncbi:serine hydrolase [Flavobacterium sp. GSP6]|uniref:serine hydrolase n=1 Tax=Flavobacterium sp. GSP6 TaxID=2497488 RepID=UPI0018F52D1D